LLSTLVSPFDLFKNLLNEEVKKENSNNSAETNTIECDLCGKHFIKRGIKIHVNARTVRKSKNF